MLFYLRFSGLPIYRTGIFETSVGPSASYNLKLQDYTHDDRGVISVVDCFLYDVRVQHDVIYRVASRVGLLPFHHPFRSSPRLSGKFIHRCLCRVNVCSHYLLRVQFCALLNNIHNPGPV